MTPDRIRAHPVSLGAARVPSLLGSWLAPFRDCFTAPVWQRVLILVAGAVLAPGQRTVSAALRVMGLADQPASAASMKSSARPAGIRTPWRAGCSIICSTRLLPTGEVVIGIDDTIERRWGPNIAARGIYRDPVRSSRGFFVKTSGLRWLSLMVVLPVPWAKRKRGAAVPDHPRAVPAQQREAGPAPQAADPLGDPGDPAILQTRRWLPDRRITIVGDSSFATLELIAAVRRHVRLITRLRLDANLFAPALPRQPGQRGRRSLVTLWAGKLMERRPPPCARAGPPGTPSGSPPSAMPSPRSAGHFGPHRIFRCPGRATTLSKFPRHSCRVSSRPSATPPDDLIPPPHGAYAKPIASRNGQRKAELRGRPGMHAQLIVESSQWVTAGLR